MLIPRLFKKILKLTPNLPGFPRLDWKLNNFIRTTCTPGHSCNYPRHHHDAENRSDAVQTFKIRTVISASLTMVCFEYFRKCWSLGFFTEGHKKTPKKNIQRVAVLPIYTTVVSWKAAQNAQYIKPQRGWATKAEDHVGFYSCQLRTGIWGYNGHRLTVTRSMKIRKTNKSTGVFFFSSLKTFWGACSQCSLSLLTTAASGLLNRDRNLQ